MGMVSKSAPLPGILQRPEAQRGFALDNLEAERPITIRFANRPRHHTRLERKLRRRNTRNLALPPVNVQLPREMLTCLPTRPQRDLFHLVAPLRKLRFAHRYATRNKHQNDYQPGQQQWNSPFHAGPNAICRSRPPQDRTAAQRQKSSLVTCAKRLLCESSSPESPRLFEIRFLHAKCPRGGIGRRARFRF